MKNPLKNIGKKVRGAFSGSSSRHSHGTMSSVEEYSSHHGLPSETHEEQEHEAMPQQTPLNEEAAPLRMQDIETGLLLTVEEMEKLNHLRHREFKHTKVIDPKFLKDTGMYEEFFDVFAAIGWGEFWDFSEHLGSKILTLEFLSTVRVTETTIYFRLRNQDYDFTWDHLAACLGFMNFKTNVEVATRGFNRQEFWHEITGENLIGKTYPRTSHICHPTLRFMHKWIGITLFPRDDIRIVREIDNRILYAMVNRIRIAPVKAMVHHWITIARKNDPIEFTSIITKLCDYILILDDTIQYIPTPRTVLGKYHFIQAKVITRGPNDTIEFILRKSNARLILPQPELKLYGGHPLMPNVPGVGGRRSFAGPFTRGQSRAEQQDDSDNEGTSNAMHTSGTGRRRSARLSLSSSQEIGNRSHRHDMELLRSGMATLRTNHEAIHTATVETQQQIQNFEESSNRNWCQAYTSYHLPVPPYIPQPPHAYPPPPAQYPPQQYPPPYPPYPSYPPQ
jgi:hypothetical protein